MLFSKEGRSSMRRFDAEEMLNMHDVVGFGVVSESSSEVKTSDSSCDAPLKIINLNFSFKKSISRMSRWNWSVVAMLDSRLECSTSASCSWADFSVRGTSSMNVLVLQYHNIQLLIWYETHCGPEVLQYR